MSKYDALWVWIKEKGIDGFKPTFAEIQQIAGLPIDHSFLKYKKELRQTMKRISIRRALEKAGFCYAGTMKNNAVKNGKILNMALYSTAESKRNRLLFDAKTLCALHPAGVRRCHV